MRIALMVAAILSLSVGVHAASHDWRQLDGTNDLRFTVGWGQADSPTAPAAPSYLGYLDLKALTIQETNESIVVTFENQAGFQSQSTDPFPADRYITHTVHFQVPGTDKIGSVDLYSGMPATAAADNGFYPLGAVFCVLGTSADAHCKQVGERLTYSTSGTRAEVVLAKAFLDEVSEPTEIPRLSGIQAFGIHDASKQPPCCEFDTGWVDQLPDSGFAPDFELAGPESEADGNASGEPSPKMPSPGVGLVIAGVVAALASVRRFSRRPTLDEDEHSRQR